MVGQFLWQRDVRKGKYDTGEYAVRETSKDGNGNGKGEGEGKGEEMEMEHVEVAKDRG